MLNTLHITNLAIIEQLRLEFAPGFVALTGETGAGKSIIIDAIGLLLGGKADPNLVRAGAEAARVEGVFRLHGETRDLVHAILAREDLLDADTPPDEVTLAREVRREGRSLTRLNGRMVNTAILREVAQLLVDIHGQSEHLSLLRPREHLYLLDRFAGLEAERETFAARARDLDTVRQELTKLRQDERERQRRLDMLTFQLNEIGAAKLKPGEETTLLQERNRLANAEKLAKLADEAVRALSGGEDTPSTADLLKQASRALANLIKLDPALAPQRDLAESLAAQFRELGYDLSAYRDRIEFNPKRLDALENRLELIKGLQRKYGASVDDILAFAAKAQAERDTLLNADERIETLAKQEEALLRELGPLGAALSHKRRTAGEQLARGIEAELADLKMERARFGVDIQWQDDPAGVYVEGRRVAYEATGLDKLEFMIAPNPGEGLKPLAKIASGGETARLMLALKGVLARADRTPTLIFDEIDQGIGGRVGTVVGRKLWGLAASHQVLCITHLPQLAGFGDQHLKVEKVIVADRTQTTVRELHGPTERTAELAQMLGGAGEKTLASAWEILLMVKGEKENRG